MVTAFTPLQLQEHLQHIDMANFAKLNEQNIVDSVIVAEQDFIDTLNNKWIQTSFNTKGGIHYGQDGKPDGGLALKGNFAGIGDIYDEINDVFYSQKPFPSWVLNKSIWGWEAPVVYPADGNDYKWDETTLSWIPVPLKTPVETLP